MRQGSVIAVVCASGAVAAAAAACLAFPLTANPGPESATVLGLVGGISLCLAQAARAAQKSDRGYVDDATGGLVVGGVFVLLFMLATTLGRALHPTCKGSEGYWVFLALSAPVLALQVALGTWLGRLVRRPARAVILAVLVQLGAGAWLAWSAYRGPSFRVLSHLFVAIPGDLLQGVQLPPALLVFRAGTLAFAAALLLLGAAQFPRIRRSGLSRPAVTSGWMMMLAVVAVVVGGYLHVQGRDGLGPSRDAWQDAYSLIKKRGPLVVHADPLALRPKDVDAMLAEGTLWLERLQERLGVSPSADIDIYVHADRGAQARLTGASHVDFTLPWRREIHVVGADVPHQSLGHELAHALAGELSDTVLKVPSRFVFMHNAAVTEGLAVALTPELSTSSSLTVREQSAAMRRVGFAPPLASTFSGLSFFKESPTRAYTAAGAVVETWGARGASPAASWAQLYKEGALNKAIGGDDAAAEFLQQHERTLDEMPLPADALSWAKERFKRPSILQQECTDDDDDAQHLRVVSRTSTRAEALAALSEREADDVGVYEALYGDALALEDPSGAEHVAQRWFAAGGASEALQARGDAAFVAGALRDAEANWLRVTLGDLQPPQARTLLAKRMLVEAARARPGKAPVAEAALRVLVASKNIERLAAFEALGVALGAHVADDGEPASAVVLARYILARRLVQDGALAEGIVQLRRVLAEGGIPSVYIEQARLALATALVRSGAPEEAEPILLQAADEATRPAMRMLFRDKNERAARAAAAPDKPDVVTATTDPAWADRLLLGSDAAGDF